MPIPKKLDKQTLQELRSIFSRLNISRKKVTIDLNNDTIEVEEDYSIEDLLESSGAITPERAKEMNEDVRSTREEWD